MEGAGVGGGWNFLCNVLYFDRGWITLIYTFFRAYGMIHLRLGYFSLCKYHLYKSLNKHKRTVSDY
jgi:hypothetical protein